MCDWYDKKSPALINKRGYAGNLCLDKHSIKKISPNPLSPSLIGEEG